MRVLVCGGRDYADQNAILSALDALEDEHGEIVVIQGGASGADLIARLMYWVCSTPAERSKLKAAKWKAQRGLCAMCDKPMDVKGSELDRADPVDGYTAENTRLVHHACHRADQATKGFR